MKKSPSSALLSMILAFAISCELPVICEAQPAANKNDAAAATEKHSRYRAAVRDATGSIDAGEAGLLTGSYENENLDILAKAQKAIRVKAALSLPPPRDEMVGRFALEAEMLNDKLGSLNEADGCLPTSDKPALDQLCLEKALTYATKASKMTKDDKARIYMELAKSYESESPQKAFDFDKLASELLTDSSPQKPALFNEMANLSQRVASQVAAKEKSKPAENSKSTTEENAPKVPSTTQKPTGVSKQTDQISLLRQAAEAGEKSKEKGAYGRYLTLANAEATLELLDRSVKDCQRAIELYNGVAAPSFEYWGFSRIAPLNPSVVASCLVRNGRTSDGAKLMESAAIRVQALNGLSARETKEQLKVLMHFYIDRKDDVKATLALDRVLNCKMQPSGISSVSFSFHTDTGFQLEDIYSWAASVAKTRPAFAEGVLSKVLAAQRKQLPADDRQIADTLLAFASVHEMLNNDVAALADYQQAFDIRKLYVGEKSAIAQFPDNYLKQLQAAGKNSEAERLGNLRREFQAAGGRRRQPDVKRGSDQDISVLKAEYGKAKADAPYSWQTERALSALRSTARRKQDWKLAMDCIIQQLELATHFRKPLNEIAKFQEQLIDLALEAQSIDGAKTWLRELERSGGVSASELSRFQQKIASEYTRESKFDDASKNFQELWKASDADASTLYQTEVELIVALNRAGKESQAKHATALLFEQHARWIPKLKSSYEALTIAKLGFDADQTKWVPDLLAVSESLLPKDQFDLSTTMRLADFWKKIGNVKRADELTAKCKAFMLEKARSHEVRFSPSDPDKGRISIVQTKAGLNFPQPEPTKNYSFNFAALSSDSLTFDDHARVVVERPDEIAFAGTYGALKTAQTANHAAGLSFTYGEFKGTPIAPSSQSGNAAAETVRQIKLPSVPQLPFKPALAVEKFHKSFPGLSGQGIEIGLGPGDYQTFCGLTVDSLRLEGTGTTRVFISEQNNGSGLAFYLPPQGRVNAALAKGLPIKGCSIEIWYSGTKTIKLDADSTFNGIIYAPNAKIEIGPGDAHFCGAIVARDIVVTGNSQIFWEPTLANWKEDLELH